MLCKKCGKDVSDDFNLCPYCGASLNENQKKKNKKPVFYIVAIIILMLVVCIAVISAHNKKSNDNVVTQSTTTTVQTTESTTSETTTEQESTTEEISKEQSNLIKEGETVSAGELDFTLKKVELSYQVNPDNPPSYYHYYDAESGHVYIHIDADIKNNKKRSVDCENLYSVEADYNDGYKYQGFVVVEEDDGDFTDRASFEYVDPLQTKGVHYLIDCPQEVEESDNPLFITIRLTDGKKYKFIIRK